MPFRAEKGNMFPRIKKLEDKHFFTTRATLAREMYSTRLTTLYHSDAFIHDVLAKNDSFTCANIIFNVSKLKYGTFENFVSGPFLAGNSKFWNVESQIVQFHQLYIVSIWFLLGMAGPG